MGLKHPHLEELLRDLLVDEARSLWRAKGVVKPNISQIAVTTGLNRKEVTLRVRHQIDPLPHTELSAAAKTFTLWLQRASEEPLYRRLSTANQQEGQSFESIARLASRGDVHHRAVLDELVRLGMVAVSDGWAELLADGFVPTKDLQTTLAFLGDNTRDHLLAAVSNTLDEAPPFLERAVFADGLAPEDCKNIHQQVRERWDSLHHELVGQLSKAVDRSDGGGTSRMRIGIYVYHEEAGPSARPDSIEGGAGS